MKSLSLIHIYEVKPVLGDLYNTKDSQKYLKKLKELDTGSLESMNSIFSLASNLIDEGIAPSDELKQTISDILAGFANVPKDAQEQAKSVLSVLTDGCLLYTSTLKQ